MTDISRVKSLRRWTARLREANNKEKFHGFRFVDCEPGSTHDHWVSLTQKICPICDGFQQGRDKQDGQDYYCLCATLQYLDRRWHEFHLYESWCEPLTLDALTPIPLPSVEAANDLNKLLDAVKEWMVEPTSWMFIQGGVGCAKSHVLQAIKTTLPWMTCYISAAQLQGSLFASFKKDDTQELIRAMSLAPILLLDDLGLEHPGAWTTNMFASVIDNRYARRTELATIVTTNIDPADLIGSVNQATRRIASRITDRGVSKRFILRQTDYRNILRKDLKKMGAL